MRQEGLHIDLLARAEGQLLLQQLVMHLFLFLNGERGTSWATRSARALFWARRVAIYWCASWRSLGTGLSVLSARVAMRRLGLEVELRRRECIQTIR